ncbi:hypothetical protein, partial [Xenorhabdus bovienii]|uniref:hypothetical protein n=1 Tax=Xenorhabdus bovienii TaxID=40576 RepID=UPI0023B2675F
FVQLILAIHPFSFSNYRIAFPVSNTSVYWKVQLYRLESLFLGRQKFHRKAGLYVTVTRLIK